MVAVALVRQHLLGVGAKMLSASSFNRDSGFLPMTFHGYLWVQPIKRDHDIEDFSARCFVHKRHTRTLSTTILRGRMMKS